MDKKMLINAVEPEECRIAILENNVLEELYIERSSREQIAGNIYKGRVVNIEPSIEAGFVDIGLKKNGFLHASDILIPKENGNLPSDADAHAKPHRTFHKIRDVLHTGQEVLVQVTKESIGTKGPSLTTYISLPGRFLVLRKGLALQRRCLMDCEIRLFAPFEWGSSVSYRLPWSSSSTFYPEMSRVTSNQDLLFVGKPMGTYDDPTYLSSFYPEMNPYEAPLFRLTSDGKSQLIGTYIDDIGYSNFPLSTDGRYYILGSVEQDRFLLYDALEHIVLSELPKKPGLDYFYTNVAFLPAGMIINQVASTTDKYYRTFYHVYSLESGETYHWEVPENEFYECSDFLASNALICLRYDLISNSQDLVRFDLDLQEATTLTEKVNSIVFTTQ